MQQYGGVSASLAWPHLHSRFCLVLDISSSQDQAAVCAGSKASTHGHLWQLSMHIACPRLKFMCRCFLQAHQRGQVLHS